MRTLIAFILVALLAFFAYQYLGPKEKREMHRTGDDISRGAERAKDSIASGAEKIKENWDKTVVDFDRDKIKEEMARTGRVVRQKAREAGAVIADATADARVTAAIKAKYVADRDLSALKISVNTTGGLVTLSGTVSSLDSIGQAIRLALETDGVREVVSTLQVEGQVDAKR